MNRFVDRTYLFYETTSVNRSDLVENDRTAVIQEIDLNARRVFCRGG